MSGKAKPSVSVTVDGGALTVVVKGSKDAKRAVDVMLGNWFRKVKGAWRLRTGLDPEVNDPISVSRALTNLGYDVELEM